jgi:hypothetical protein
MGKVAGPQKLDTLAPGPLGKGLHFHLLTGGPAVLGMEMKIGDEFHQPSSAIRPKIQNSQPV